MITRTGRASHPASRPRWRPLASCAALLVALAAITASGAGPVFWQTATRGDFMKGDIDNLSIDNDGRLRLGPAVQLVHDSNSPFLWTVLPAPGGSYFVGSGNEGKVFRVDKAGAWSDFYDAPELEVHALALAADGGIYVGTSPDGKIYKVDAKGTAKTFFEPKAKYIWAMATDAKGNLFAATGDKGLIYRITPDGKGDVFYRTKATHVLAMAFDRRGNLIVGTESPGMVFSIDPSAKAFVLLDSPFREIHAVRVDENGAIYAAGVGAKQSSEERGVPEAVTGGGETTRSTAIPSVSTEITAVSVVDVSPMIGGGDTKSARREERRSAKGAIYRILPDGTTDQVWESPDDLPYDVMVEPSGSLLVGTGNKGKIYRVTLTDPPRVTLLARAPAQQVTQLVPDGTQGGVLLASANPGKLLRLSGRQADSGTYVSEVHDGETQSTWGTISWRAAQPSGSQVQLFTRTGNSQIPDDTWSAWSEAYTNSSGQAIGSPKARFLQWKAVLKGTDSPILTSVTAAYLQKNVRPRLTSINVYPPGVVFQKPFSTGEAEIAGFEDTMDRPQTSGNQPTSLSSMSSAGPAMGRRVYQKGLQTFVWKAEDDNDDKLQYDVQYRRDDETSWSTLKTGLADSIFVWDTTSVPNGTYTVRVIASDAPSNPPGMAMTGEMDSTTFDVDNTPPTIRVTGMRRDGKRVILNFEVRDDQSAVQRVDYSVSAERWRTIYPKDGIADSRLEQYELTLDNEAQARNLVIRAMDAMNNAATARGDVVESTPSKR